MSYLWQLEFVMHSRAHVGSSSVVAVNTRYVSFSHARFLVGHVFLSRYIFTAMYSFVPFCSQVLQNCAATCLECAVTAGFFASQF
jgi:hypothetical protein